MLHILRESPFHADMTSILRYISPGDDILLLQDSVIAALDASCHAQWLRSSPATVSALKADIEARGLIAQISDSVNVIDYNGFVGLVIKHANTMSW